MDVQLDQFKVGDVLRIVGELEEVIVDKVWIATQGPYTWVDYEGLTRRTRRRVMVGVEYDDGEWETVVYNHFPQPYEIDGAQHLSATIGWNGTIFHRQEKGRCTLRLVSHDGTPIPCVYADYSGPHDEVLAIEVFGEEQSQESPVEVEIFVGRTVVPSDVQLYLPVDTAPRVSFVRGSAAAADPAITFGRRQFVMAGVAIAIVLLFAVMILQ